MSERCEPPEGTAQDCLCWIEIDGKVTTARWDAEDRIWTPERASSFHCDSPYAQKHGLRYLAPVSSPEAVRALVEAAKASQAAMLSALDYLRHIDTCAACEIALEDAALAMKAALSPFPEPKAKESEG